MNTFRRLLLLIIGFLPFLLGTALNKYMMINSDDVPPLFLIAIILLLLWCFLGCLFTGDRNRTQEGLIWLNIVAAIDLILVGAQELFLHAYWMNNIGALTQFYYLPLLNIGFSLTGWSYSVFPAYVASFLLMVGASFAGCKIRKKIQR